MTPATVLFSVYAAIILVLLTVKTWPLLTVQGRAERRYWLARHQRAAEFMALGIEPSEADAKAAQEMAKEAADALRVAA